MTHEILCLGRKLRPRKVFPAALALLGALLAARLIQAVTFTEILYDPPGPAGEKDGHGDTDREKLEFIEIFNDSPTTVELSGHHFAEGVSFVFPEGTFLGGKGYLVLCADEKAIRNRFGIKNTIGDFKGALEKTGDELVLLDRSGAIAARVDFRDRGKWTSAPAGTGYTLSLKDPFLDTARPENWAPSALPWGTPGAENFPSPRPEETEVFGESAPWRYRRGWDGTAAEEFSDPPEAWRQPDFDDSSWEEGPAGIGYGDPEIRTVLEDMEGQYLAFAARKRFTVPRRWLDEMDSAVLRIHVDDGFVAYLGGEEIARCFLPAAPRVYSTARATGFWEVSVEPFVIPIPRDKLREGENVLAIQVHNRNLQSTDACLVPSLHWRKKPEAEASATPAVRLSEVLRVPAPGEKRWLEIFNASDKEVKLGGYVITGDPLRRHPLAAPAVPALPAGGYLTLDEAELGFLLEDKGSRGELRIFIFEPGGEKLADAAILELPERLPAGALSQARLPHAGGVWYASTTPTPGEGNQVPLERDVVIHEIMYHPLVGPEYPMAGGKVLEAGEYIELHNRGDHRVSLDGWALTKGYNYPFPDGTWLEPGGFLVVAPDPEYIRKTYSLPPGIVLGPEASGEARAAFGVLSNSGEAIRLEDALGNPVDEVRYHDGGDWDGLADGGGSSLELIDARQENDLPGAWATSDETGRAPWREYSYTERHGVSEESEIWLFLIDDGECLVDEISVKKGDVEHVPDGGFEGETTEPWRIDGNHVRSRRTTNERHAGKACLHLVATGGGDTRVNHVEVDTSPPMDGGLFTVSFWARWLQGSRRLHTCAYDNDSLGRNHLLDVPSDLGTPGRENSRRARLRAATGSDNLGPVIGEARHLPAVPTVLDPARVLARITDSDGIQEARVEYRLETKAAEARSAPLRDDGKHGDGAAGDGLFGGEIPPHGLGAKVLFNIVATDGGGRVRRFPTGAPERTLLYQVGLPCESRALRSRLILDDENRAILGSRNLYADDPVSGAFVFEESQVTYNIGVTYHGSPWQRRNQPRMFSLRFPGDKRFRGFSRVNLSRGGEADEGVAYQLLRLATRGEKARTSYTPRYNYLMFYLDGQPHWGCEATAEIIPPGKDYLRVLFPEDPDGTAYKVSGKQPFDDGGDFKGRAIWTALRSHGASKESYRFFFNPATRSEEDNFDPLLRLLDMFDASVTPQEKFEDPVRGIESILNVESFLRVFAARVLMNDWDTLGSEPTHAHNLFLYYAPIEKRFHALPWDLDCSFDNPGFLLAPSELATDPGVYRLVNSSAKYRRAYLRMLKEFTTTFWTPDAFFPWLDRIEGEMKGMVKNFDKIKTFMKSRLSVLRSKIPRLHAEVPFALTSPSGQGLQLVRGRKATIRGMAPLEIVKIFISRGGKEAEEARPAWSGVMGTAWSLEVPLEPGENAFRLEGLSLEGERVGKVLTVRLRSSGD